MQYRTVHWNSLSMFLFHFWSTPEVLSTCVLCYFRFLNNEEATNLRNCRLGNLASQVLFCRAPRLYKFVPSLVGVDMWRQGASNKLVQLQSQLGLSLSLPSIRGVVDHITEDYKDRLREKQKELERVNSLMNRFEPLAFWQSCGKDLSKNDLWRLLDMSSQLS